mmetsp:Transcript_26009/g.39937  ORF Transcript_26009/g.39937 Transcript_26009/m.39937 type:complete len:1041 (-) Transcript_26009:87-3209(-)
MSSATGTSTLGDDKSKTSRKGSSSSSSSATTKFPVGSIGGRELKKALKKTKNPAGTIQAYQRAHSLHTMMARAFGTTPRYEETDDSGNSHREPLDTDSVLTFLSHLGVSQYEVHKRISDTLRSQLEDEIRNMRGAEEPLQKLLQNCWPYATLVPELRPVLWAVLKQLGPKTPLPLLQVLAERDTKKNGAGLKYAEIWTQLTPLLKRLVWEADWDRRIPEENQAMDIEPTKFLEMMDSTLLGEKIQPLVEEYCTQDTLVMWADQTFAMSIRQRRIATTQRRAITTTTLTTAGTTASSSAVTTASATTSVTAQLHSHANRSGTTQTETTTDLSGSGRAVSKLRHVMGGSATGSGSSGSSTTSASSSTYRPKLLNAVLSMLMARHGQQDPTKLPVGGSSLLHCTLVSDLLLSAGGPLPKSYEHVLALARVLDESVKSGELSDSAVATVQVHLKSIFQAEGIGGTDAAEGNPPGKSGTTETPKDPKQDHVNFVKNLLKQIITEALSAMKKADPQHLFENPVTDEIAPGYSNVIKKPMCIKTIERKLKASRYSSISEWDNDVQLIFRNCITYNTGNSGQWFRGEARRQNHVFKDKILPQAKKLYNVEMAKRSKLLDANRPKKRKATAGVDNSNGNGDEVLLSAKDIEPLPASKFKKRKKDNTTNNTNINQENTPSIPAIASMILADPFVVRLILDRVLRSIKIDLLRGTSLPSAHRSIPSLLQLLHIAQSSTQLCATRGKKYFVPDAGIIDPNKSETNNGGGGDTFSFASLRKITPLLIRLMVESELDRRTSKGGDLSLVSSEIIYTRSAIGTGGDDDALSSSWEGVTGLHVARCLAEGALVHVCQPNLNDTSLALTFPRFAIALRKLSCNLWNERPFFVSLIKTLLKHKMKLAKLTRDEIVSAWLGWFVAADDNSKSSSEGSSSTRRGNRSSTSSTRSMEGAMCSALHENFLCLLNEWAALGNLLLPRDMLLKFANDAVIAADASETLPSRKFVVMWQDCGEDDNSSSFSQVKAQYNRMLQSIPGTNAEEWKKQVGLVKEEKTA